MSSRLTNEQLPAADEWRGAEESAVMAPVTRLQPPAAGFLGGSEGARVRRSGTVVTGAAVAAHLCRGTH